MEPAMSQNPMTANIKENLTQKRGLFFKDSKCTETTEGRQVEDQMKHYIH